MPKYFNFKVGNHFLYFTAHCIVEAMHVHASQDSKLRQSTSSKFFVKENGDTTIEKRGIATEQEIIAIQKFIKQHYQEMYLKWSEISDNGFYQG